MNQVFLSSKFDNQRMDTQSNWTPHDYVLQYVVRLRFIYSPSRTIIHYDRHYPYCRLPQLTTSLIISVPSVSERVGTSPFRARHSDICCAGELCITILERRWPPLSCKHWIMWHACRCWRGSLIRYPLGRHSVYFGWHLRRMSWAKMRDSGSDPVLQLVLASIFPYCSF